MIFINAGWHESSRLDSSGDIQSYQAKNGGGYTLEALFGIIPNGIAEPDYEGWEAEEKRNKIGYIYFSPVYLGEITDLSYFLKTMQSGLIVYDPATRVTQNNNGKMKVKARNQFRINFNDLHNLYENFYEQIV